MKEKLESLGCLIALFLFPIFITSLLLPKGNKKKEQLTEPTPNSYKATSSSFDKATSSSSNGTNVYDERATYDNNSPENRIWEPTTPHDIGYHDGYVTGQRDAANNASRYSSYFIHNDQQYSEEEMEQYKSGYSSGYADGYNILHDEKERKRAEEERSEYSSLSMLKRSFAGALLNQDLFELLCKEVPQTELKQILVDTYLLPSSTSSTKITGHLLSIALSLFWIA